MQRTLNSSNLTSFFFRIETQKKVFQSPLIQVSYGFSVLLSHFALPLRGNTDKLQGEFWHENQSGSLLNISLSYFTGSVLYYMHWRYFPTREKIMMQYYPSFCLSSYERDKRKNSSSTHYFSRGNQSVEISTHWEENNSVIHEVTVFRKIFAPNGVKVNENFGYTLLRIHT
jgi:hypothetical protein